MLLKKVDLIFTDDIIDLVSLLEILDIGFGMRGGDYLTYRNVVELLAKTYTDDNFKQVIGAIRYKYSTIEQLQNGREYTIIKVASVMEKNYIRSDKDYFDRGKVVL